MLGEGGPDLDPAHIAGDLWPSVLLEAALVCLGEPADRGEKAQPWWNTGKGAQERVVERKKIQKETMDFLEQMQLPKPTLVEEWRLIWREVGTLLAAKHFISHTPVPVMDLPVADVVDSKEQLRFRAMCDERISFPFEELRPFEDVYAKLALYRKLITIENVNSVMGKVGGKEKHIFWAKTECGLVLSSVTPWEIISKEKGVTTGGYMCKHCQGFWKQGWGATRLVQII